MSIPTASNSKLFDIYSVFTAKTRSGGKRIKAMFIKSSTIKTRCYDSIQLVGAKLSPLSSKHEVHTTTRGRGHKAQTVKTKT